jgi:4-amino-4-deoxy-L-arabinose transferase-like glycosyltransferase
MDAVFRRRWSAFVLIGIAWAATVLPNLGTVSLWDIDEGLNAEAAREMSESGDWIVPRFNFQLRDAKPALLYWCVAAVFQIQGVDEWGARLPSALAVLIAALGTYELGRAMFTPTIGAWAAIALVSSGLVVALGRFTNPDALLLAWTVWTFLAFWRGYAPTTPHGPTRTAWFVPFGISCGLATLAKGPIGLLLPSLTVLLFLTWQRDLKNLGHRHLLWGAIAFACVALPWYLLVTIQTRGAFATGFFLKNNIERFLKPIHTHRGSFLYHPLFLLVGFAPWSVWILPTLRLVWRDVRRTATQDTIVAGRLLLLWLAAYLLFFSVSATKLPGYGLPMYPALALLTARFLDSWRRGKYRPSRALLVYSIAWVFVIGAGLSLGYALLSGRWGILVPHFRPIAGLGNLIGLGLGPAVLAASVIVLAWRRLRSAAVGTWMVGCVAIVGIVFALTLPLFNEAKAPKALIAALPENHLDHDWRLASYVYFQPSLVFYAEREVPRFDDDRRAIEHLAIPTPAVLFVARSDWEKLQERLPGKVLAQAWDFYRNEEVLAVGNEAAVSATLGSPLAQR